MIVIATSIWSKVKLVVANAIKTFVETATALFIAGAAGLDYSGDGVTNSLITLGISAVAGAMSAVWNSISSVIDNFKATEESTTEESTTEESTTEE